MTESFDAPALPAGKTYGAGNLSGGPKAGGMPVLPVAILGVGLYLVWFGVHYWESDVKWPSDPVKAILTGKPLPDSQPVVPDVGAAVGQVPTGITQIVKGGAEASIWPGIVARDSGKGYVWGGKADVPGDWDCSSAVSFWLGHDFGIAPLPGGGKYGDPGYPPHAHGPGSTDYMLWGTGVNAAQAQIGDLVVSTEHIGVYLGGGQMLSARDPQEGTGVGPVNPFPGGTPVYRRPNYLSDLH